MGRMAFRRHHTAHDKARGRGITQCKSTPALTLLRFKRFVCKITKLISTHRLLSFSLFAQYRADNNSPCNSRAPIVLTV